MGCDERPVDRRIEGPRRQIAKALTGGIRASNPKARKSYWRGYQAALYRRAQPPLPPSWKHSVTSALVAGAKRTTAPQTLDRKAATVHALINTAPPATHR